jgi:hypothetical protein
MVKTILHFIKKRIRLGIIYTMGVNEQCMNEYGYAAALKGSEDDLANLFGQVEVIYSTDTYQFDDYIKYAVTGVDVSHKAKWREERFSLVCAKAFAMGERFCGKI